MRVSVLAPFLMLLWKWHCIQIFSEPRFSSSCLSTDVRSGLCTWPTCVSEQRSRGTRAPTRKTGLWFRAEPPPAAKVSGPAGKSLPGSVGRKTSLRCGRCRQAAERRTVLRALREVQVPRGPRVRVPERLGEKTTSQFKFLELSGINLPWAEKRPARRPPPRLWGTWRWS